MSLLVILVILLLVFGVGGGTYSRWGAGSPAWGGHILWILFVVVLIALLLNVLGVYRY